MGSTNRDIDRVILTFVGGDLDGRLLTSDSLLQSERTVVEMFLGGSNRGETGRSVKSMVSYRAILEGRMNGSTGSLPSTMIHDYQVIHRSTYLGVCRLWVKHQVHEMGRKNQLVNLMNTR